MSFNTLCSSLFLSIQDLILTHLTPNERKLAVLFILTPILGVCLSKLQNAKLRYTFGLIVGLFYQVFAFGGKTIFNLIPAGLTYLLAYLYGRKCLKPIIITVILYSSIFHIFVSFYDWDMFEFDVGISLMMHVWKFIAFAWAYRDGGISENELSDDQNYRKIQKFPSLLEYFSYIFFFPSSLVGPLFDFKDYQLFIEKQGPFKDIPYSKGILYGLQSLIFGALSGLGYHLFKDSFHPDNFLKDDFMNRSLLSRIWFIWISGYIVRFRIYGGFYLAQGGIDICGLSFTGYKNGKPVFDRVLACARYAELTANAAVAIKRWNSSTQACLEKYVYNRMLDYDKRKGKKPNKVLASCTTFFLASTWHGFHLHCYLTFFGLGLCIFTAIAVYKSRDKFKWVPEWISLPIRYIGTTIPGNLAAAGLAVGNISKCLKLYSTVYWLPILMNIVIIAFLTLSGWTRSHTKHHEKEVKKSYNKPSETENKKIN